MSQAVFRVLFAAALVAGLALRLAAPGVRPMHHDEANQAVRFGLLLETGEYRYDRNDHHGPTLYYLTLPVAWLRGQTTFASLDERTLRTVPALFGAGVILLFGLLTGALGRTAVAAGALLAAVSPALTYYSRFYIQESLLVFFGIGFVIALGRHRAKASGAWAVLAGIFAGLAYSTKETSVIVLGAALAACALAGRPAGAPPRPLATRLFHAGLALAAATLIALVSYSSFFTNPPGVLESIRAFTVYAARGVGAGTHAEPWYYYLRLLSWSSSGGLVWTEGLVLVLAVAGIVVALRARRFWPRYIALYSLIAALVFSVLPYKTPWNLLSFHAGFVLLAGAGAAALVERVRPRAPRVILVALLLAATWHLTVQDWRANFRYPADARNPYAYAQTAPDFLRLVKRVDDLSTVHPDGARMFVAVIAGPYEQWPLPWYLRRMARVGYWTRVADAGSLRGAPVIVSSEEHAAEVDATLGEGYVSEFYGLRPGVLLTLHVERGLWRRFLESHRLLLR